MIKKTSILRFKTSCFRFFVSLALPLFFVPLLHAETFPVIKNKTVLTECVECHMAFSPITLPKASWKAMMGNLSDHFGEDASLDPEVTQEILNYYASNASDVIDTHASGKWQTTQTPKRLTSLPRFIDNHGSCSDAVWNNEKVKSKANCLACHTTMQKDGSTDANVTFLPKKIRQGCSWYQFSDLMFWK